MNARRISRPSGVRIGMFCRFGSLLLNRPVDGDRLVEAGVHAAGLRDAPAAAARRCRCPSASSAARHSRIWRGMSWVSASSSSTSTAVDGAFDVPVRFSTGSCSLSNRISDELFRRVDVELAAGHLEDRRRPLRQLLIDFLRLRRQRRRVDADAGALDRHQHRHQRQLQRRVDVAQLFLREQIAQRRRQLADQIGALARRRRPPRRPARRRARSPWPRGRRRPPPTAPCSWCARARDPRSGAPSASRRAGSSPASCRRRARAA